MNCQIICASQIVQQMDKFNKQNLPTIFDAVKNNSATQSYFRNLQTVSVYITVKVKFSYSYSTYSNRNKNANNLNAALCTAACCSYCAFNRNIHSKSS